MADVPQAARDAAHEATACRVGEPGWTEMLGKSPRDLIDIALEAAWPRLLAEAGKLVSGGDVRRIAQEAFDEQKSRVLDEVAKVTDERLERTARLVRAAERHLERARISNGAEDLKFTLHRPGYGPAQGTSLEVVPLGELLKLIGGDGD